MRFLVQRRVLDRVGEARLRLGDHLDLDAARRLAGVRILPVELLGEQHAKHRIVAERGLERERLVIRFHRLGLDLATGLIGEGHRPRHCFTVNAIVRLRYHHPVRQSEVRALDIVGAVDIDGVGGVREGLAGAVDHRARSEHIAVLVVLDVGIIAPHAFGGGRAQVGAGQVPALRDAVAHQREPGVLAVILCEHRQLQPVNGLRQRLAIAADHRLAHHARQRPLDGHIRIGLQQTLLVPDRHVCEAHRAASLHIDDRILEAVGSFQRAAAAVRGDQRGRILAHPAGQMLRIGQRQRAAVRDRAVHQAVGVGDARGRAKPIGDGVNAVQRLVGERDVDGLGHAPAVVGHIRLPIGPVFPVVHLLHTAGAQHVHEESAIIDTAARHNRALPGIANDVFIVGAIGTRRDIVAHHPAHISIRSPLRTAVHDRHRFRQDAGLAIADEVAHAAHRQVLQALRRIRAVKRADCRATIFLPDVTVERASGR
ncbi:hypothetical protein DUGA6_56680 [Duganella sp. HH105]|nr:hypothetical protein DUGA6_56680 [Duganella sp. HH105]